MGSMSTSDAAPLPRLGEVFFDVRSASRSLRISWYADTGVAVLSIWQGGTCTGSFRLPMADLPRMIETLQRGPDGCAASVAGGLPADEPARTGAAGQDRYPAGSGSLHYLNGQPPGEYPDQAAAGIPATAPAGRRPAEPRAPHHPEPASAPYYLDRPGQPPYQDQPTEAHYPEQPTEAHYPEQPAEAHYPDQPAGTRYPEQPAGTRYPEQPAEARYPELASARYQDLPDPARYPDQPGAAPYRDQAATPRYPDQHPTTRYPDQQAGYPAGPGHQDMVAGPPRGRYPNDSGPDSYSAGLAGRESRPAALVLPYDRGRPGWPAAQQETGRDTGHASPAGHGLEPLPESFPYSQLLPDHEPR